MECPSCHSELSDDSRFCDVCGAALPGRCTSCGAVNRVTARFCAKCGNALVLAGAPAFTSVAASLDTAHSAHPAPSAERRQLTVMFCDLVGSTALASRLDPEDVREIIGAYHRCCAELITKAGGFVAKYMGDGALAYFGYPQAHEDDAERALRAALGLVQAVPRLRLAQESPLQVRIGVATGLVVVGDLIGEGAAQEQGVVGETPNVAARLQTLAEPGQVVICHSTRQLAGGLFEYGDLGRVALKGLAEPVQSWRVLGKSEVESRFEARHGAELTPLVGREEELELLLRRWRETVGGEGRVVLITGEPGIGKSRLTQTLMAQLSNEPHTRLRYFCSPHHQDSALYPIIAQLERAAGLQRDDTAAQRLDKLETLLAQATTEISESAPILAELLSLPTGSRYPVLDLRPQERKSKTLKALLGQLEGLAAQQPVLMIYEDVQWIDPTSLEVLDHIIDRVSSIPILLLITFRPEFVPPWSGRPQVTLLMLSRLHRREQAEMIARVAGDKCMPKEIADQIIERTDGVPLFVEELTKAVIEAGELKDEDERYALTGPLPALAIPTTLHASLMARLDRLAPVREVAQIGATLGRHFTHELISAVATVSPQQLDDALDQLVGAGLIYRRGTPPYAEYTFKHALVQDAAYQSLLRGRRQQFHRRIAQTLVERFTEVAEAEPALIAHHYTEAGLGERAVAFWQKAGQRAIERSANLEAIAHLMKGLEVLKGQPETAARDQQELVLQTTVGVPLIAVKGMAAPDVERAYRRAQQLCLQVGDASQLFRVLLGLWWFYEVKPDLRAAYELAEQLFAMAAPANDSGLIIQAHRAMGHTLFWRGEFASARTHFEQAIARYDPQQHSSLGYTFGEYAEVPSRGFAAHVLWYLGYPDRAMETMREALSIAAELTHSWTVVMINVFAAWMRAYRREPHLVQGPAECALKLAREQQLAFFVGHATVLQGWARVTQGEGEQPIADIRRGIAAYRATGAELESSYWCGLLAEAYAAVGAVERAHTALTEAVELAATSGVRFCQAELFRLKGELLLRQAETNQAETLFREAIHVASIQQAKSLELRASTSLARLLCKQAKRSEAYDLLAPIYGWFTEGFDTPDLKEAKALLDFLD
jgi:class 3 adenylate cyclase/predicted ATPase